MREPQAEARQVAPSAAEPPEDWVARLVQVEQEVRALVAALLVQAEQGVPA
jgi:hypothetical protein